jgi:hypothetical protein
MERAGTKTANATKPDMFDFFNTLQKEWMITFLRYKIYPFQKDKNYYQKLLKFKEEKIQNIAKRNTWPSIFTDKQLFRSFWKKTVRTKGCPNFIYINEEQREELQRQDLWNYYQAGEECKVDLGDEDYRIGTIVRYDSHLKEVVVDCKGKQETFNINRVNRIIQI